MQTKYLALSEKIVKIYEAKNPDEAFIKMSVEEGVSVDMFVPAYSGMVIAVTGLMNIPLSLSEYRERDIFKRYG